MTSTRGVELAEEIIQDDLKKAGPMVILLHAFKNGRGDPEAEAMMDDVIQFCFSRTEFCGKAIEDFVSDDSAIGSPVAA